MILFTDGFDWWDNTFINSTAGAKYSLLNATFFQGQTAIGRFSGSLAFQLVNTSSGFADFLIPVADFQVTQGLAIMMLGTNPGTKVFYVVKNGVSGGIVALALDASNNLLVYKGGAGNNSSPGTLLNTVTAPFSTSSFAYLELFVIVAGVNSVLEVWLDDNPLLRLGPTGPDGMVNLGSTAPDRVGYRLENGLGYVIDDFVVADSHSALNNTRLGPARIVTVFPNGNGFSSGFTAANGGADYTNVNQIASNPDATPLYISGTNSASDLFTVPTPACIGRNLGIGVNVLARGIASNASVDAAVAPIAQLPDTDLAAFNVVNASLYTGYQGVTEKDLASGANNWTDGDIGRAWWGVDLSSNSVRIAQVNLEKVVSLRAVSFDCGAGGSFAVGQ